MRTLPLGLAALMMAAPLAAQTPTPAAPGARAEMRQQMMQRERPEIPALTDEQRTKLRAIQDRHRDAMRDIADRRTAAERKREDELRSVLTEEQFRMMRGRMAAGGERRAVVGERRTANGERRAPQAPRRAPARPGR